MDVRAVTGNLRAAVDGFLFGAEPAGRLRAVRAGLSLLLALRIALSPYPGLADQPPALFRPVWYLQLLDRMPPVEVIVAAQVVGTVAAALALLGWRERGTFLVAWSSFLLLGGLRASRGKIQHNDILLVLVCVAILLAPVGVRLLDRHRSTRYGWPVRTAIAVVAIVYFSTGFQKLVTSGPAWVLSDNVQNIMYAAPLSGKAPTDAALVIATRPWLAHLVAAATMAIELGALTVLFWPRIRPLFLTGIVAMHLSIWFTHGLDYSMWAGAAAVVLVDWSEVADRYAPPWLRARLGATPDGVGRVRRRRAAWSDGLGGHGVA